MRSHFLPFNAWCFSRRVPSTPNMTSTPLVRRKEIIDPASGYFSQHCFSLSYAVAVRLFGGKNRKSAGADSIKARAKEKLPSPISRILSVDLKGIVGRLRGAAFDFFFPLGSPLSFGFETVGAWLETFPALPFLRDFSSATLAA